MKRITFTDGTTVLTSDTKLLLWCMREAGYTPAEEQTQDNGWRVVTGRDKVFAITDTQEAATAVRNALVGVGLQGPSRIEPND